MPSNIAVPNENCFLLISVGIIIIHRSCLVKKINVQMKNLVAMDNELLNTKQVGPDCKAASSILHHSQR